MKLKLILGKTASGVPLIWSNPANGHVYISGASGSGKSYELKLLAPQLPGQGIRVWGARTASSDPSWKYVNIRRLFIFIEESIKDFDAFVAVTNSSETNVLACVAAKRLGVTRTIAEVENLEYIRLAESMGVDAVINKKLITAGRIYKFTLSSKVRFIKYMSGTNAEVLEYIVAPGSAITKHPLKEMNFPQNAIIGGLIRGNDAMIAVGDTLIQAYDRVAVFALPEAVKAVDKFFK